MGPYEHRGASIAQGARPAFDRPGSDDPDAHHRLRLRDPLGATAPPAWQDVFGRDDGDGRVRSCVRPVVAVYMTAGPDEVRGLAPIQVIAFKYAEPQ